ncbi:MAG: methyl-accepting chemotaxis protein [Spirochaetes bacterium]|nr:methyl-accepting chemotaxis protein [Spirochaetota bacterium]
MKKIFDAVMKPYGAANFEFRERVRLFVNLCMMVIPILAIFFIFMNTVTHRPLVDMLNIVIVAIAFLMIMGIFIIYRGYYNIAVNAFAFAVMVGLIFNALSTDAKGSGGRFVASMCAYFMPIFFSALFCKMNAYVVVWLLGFGGTFYCTLVSQSVEHQVKPIILGTMGFTHIVTFLIGYLLVRVHEKGSYQRQQESEQKQQYQQHINEALIQSLREVSVKLDESSHKLANNALVFEKSIQNEAASIEEITATMEEISSGSENISALTRMQFEAMVDLAAIMSELENITNEMEQVSKEALLRTQRIAEKARLGEERIAHMEQRMQNVSATSVEMAGILNMINDISDRINLLSLNAAIEAARAGDYGRGFAVVADEISKLADQTSTSVKEIALLIRKSDEEVQKGVTGVQETVKIIQEILKGVEENSQLIDSLSKKMDVYVQSNKKSHDEVKKVKNLSDEIDNAIRQQKIAAEEVVGTVTNLNQMSQAIAIAAEDLTAQSKKILDMAEDVRSKITTLV